MKSVYFKIYTPEGIPIAESWEDARFEGFSKQINGGIGACIVKLGRKFDNYGEYDDVKLNNEVQVWIVDKDTDEIGRLIYSGYISQYNPYIKADGGEGVEVTLLGYYTKLAQDIWKNGTTTTFDYGGSATDIGTIFRSLLDRYQAEVSNSRITYDQEKVKLTSTTTEYKFEMLTYREGIDVLKGLAPSNWFWYLDADNRMKFQGKPTTPTHRFILGRHIRSVRAIKSIEKIKNAVLFYDDGSNSGVAMLKLYQDADSVKDYGRRIQKIMDNRVKQTTDADKIAESFIAEHKNPNVRVIAEIIDNNEDPKMGYDIESIEPGDTCEFLGFDVTLSETFRYNMVITRVDYALGRAIIEVAPMKAGIIFEQENISKKVDALDREGVQTAYTT